MSKPNGFTETVSFLHLEPPRIVSVKSRLLSAALFTIFSLAVSIPASFAGYGSLWAALAASLTGATLAIVTCQKTTPGLDLPLQHQDLVNLLAYMTEDWERKRLLQDCLFSNQIDVTQLTYAHAMQLVKMTTQVETQVL